MLTSTVAHPDHGCDNARRAGRCRSVRFDARTTPPAATMPAGLLFWSF